MIHTLDPRPVFSPHLAHNATYSAPSAKAPPAFIIQNSRHCVCTTHSHHTHTHTQSIKKNQQRFAKRFLFFSAYRINRHATYRSLRTEFSTYGLTDGLPVHGSQRQVQQHQLSTGFRQFAVPQILVDSLDDTANHDDTIGTR